MTGETLQTLELIAWDLDPSPHRPEILPPTVPPPLVDAGPTILHSTINASDLDQILTRPDLHQEFAGLEWSIEVVELRTLQAFQRRLHFDPAHTPPDPARDSLLAFAFPPPRPVTHTRPSPGIIQSPNPDLTLRPSAQGFELHGGSPFVEVALYQGRAFLRDGYHRAYSLLRAGIHAVPAVVIRAHTLAEVHPPLPNFFPGATLFSSRPPMVTDFLDPSLTLSYPTPRVLKTIRVEESFEPEIPKALTPQTSTKEPS